MLIRKNNCHLKLKYIDRQKRKNSILSIIYPWILDLFMKKIFVPFSAHFVFLTDSL